MPPMWVETGNCSPFCVPQKGAASERPTNAESMTTMRCSSTLCSRGLTPEFLFDQIRWYGASATTTLGPMVGWLPLTHPQMPTYRIA